MPNFPKNDYFLPLDKHTYVCVLGGKKCLFIGRFGVLCFLEAPAMRFALLPYYRRFVQNSYCYLLDYRVGLNVVAIEGVVSKPWNCKPIWIVLKCFLYYYSQPVILKEYLLPVSTKLTNWSFYFFVCTYTENTRKFDP